MKNNTSIKDNKHDTLTNKWITICRSDTRIWETTKEPKTNEGSSCDLFVNSFKHQKGGLTVRALVVDVARGGGSPPLPSAPQIDQPFFTSDISTNCFGMRVDYFCCFKKKKVLVSLASLPDCHHTTQQKASAQKSAGCTVSCQTKWSPSRAPGLEALLEGKNKELLAILCHHRKQWVKSLVADFSSDKVPALKTSTVKHCNVVGICQRFTMIVCFFYSLGVLFCGCC